MNLYSLKFFNKKLIASSSIEFLAVFTFLFVFFILILDVALFFRQIYLVQTIADEVLARLNLEKQCLIDTQNTIDAVNETLEFYFAKQDFIVTKADNTIKLTTDNNKYTFLIKCRTQTTPDSLIFINNYKGIIMYRKGKNISSNISSNTTYY